MQLAMTSAGGPRLRSLDVFRGLTIAGMVLVNNPGSWDAAYAPLQHAKWHGWTPTDLIFPFFVLIVGVAIPMSLERHKTEGGASANLYRRIFRRTLLIFAIGLFLNWFPPTDDPLGRLLSLRIPGVLQRIALCYLFASLLYLKTTRRTQMIVTCGLLLGYWALLSFGSAPGYPIGDLTREGSLASWIDRTLLPGHIYKPDYDPEGLLSTLPAIATAMIGVFAGEWLRSSRDGMEKAAGLFAVGLLCLLGGYLWNGLFPVNKPLWTSSYVLFTGGLGLMILGLCYWLIDLRGIDRWSWPFTVFGVNALALFALSGLVADILGEIHIAQADATSITLRNFLYQKLFASWLAPLNASLGFALSYVAFWWLMMYILYRRRIFIRV